MNAETRDSQWSRLVTGVVVLAAGVLFWLDQIDRVDAREYLEWWPLAPIAIGLAHLLERKWAGALVWVAVGVFFLLPLIGYERPSLWLLVAVWPILISVAGMTLVIQALRPPRGGSGRTGAGFHAVAVMAGNERRLAAPTPGGQAVAVMGGCEIEISPGAVDGDEITIDVLAFWGGIAIRIPRGWQVIDHVAPILGGVEVKVAPALPGAPRVLLRGSAIMAGIEVRNSKENVA